MPSKAYVVRSYHPQRQRIVALITSIVVITSGFLLYNYGYSSGRAELVEVSVDAEHQRDLNENLRNNVAQLSNERDQLTRLSSLDRDASQQVQRALGQQHSVLAELREELAFYKAIAITDDRGQDLRLLSFRLTSGRLDNGRYRFNIVVTRVRKDDQVTSAEVRLAVIGLLSGKLKNLKGEDLGGAAGAVTSFQFRNFHRVDGELRLPDGFEPQQIVVRVTALGETGSDTTLERAFPWPLS